ncbi:Ribonuclease [Ophiophagus hannah]|uniref:Ribonuclease n=1 Tax=Ophiophagus hannah TaxID=8665 RepID=V8P2W9_OPHHA|nr:Ribonuclease [Ophiophagus hannah]
MAALVKKIISTARAPAAMGPYSQAVLVDRTMYIAGQLVVKTTVLMTDMKDFNDINEVYKQFFKCNFPARAAYQVVALPKGACVEIEAIAISGPLQDASPAKI